jgi:arabinogalactan endo-1,4-beta-galactosidase
MSLRTLFVFPKLRGVTNTTVVFHWRTTWPPISSGAHVRRGYGQRVGGSNWLETLRLENFIIIEASIEQGVCKKIRDTTLKKYNGRQRSIP